MLLKFYGPRMCRNRLDVGNIFMQCLHLLRRYFVPLPWRFLTQPELQQGSDLLNSNQKHFLMWYAIKKLIVYTSMNKLRAYFGVICAPIRPSIFLHSRQANSVFGGLKLRAGGPKFCTGSLICTSSKFWLVHLVDDVRDASRRWLY